MAVLEGLVEVSLWGVVMVLVVVEELVMSGVASFELLDPMAALLVGVISGCVLMRGAEIAAKEGGGEDSWVERGSRQSVSRSRNEYAAFKYSNSVAKYVNF